MSNIQRTKISLEMNLMNQYSISSLKPSWIHIIQTIELIFFHRKIEGINSAKNARRCSSESLHTCPQKYCLLSQSSIFSIQMLFNNNNSNNISNVQLLLLLFSFNNNNNNLYMEIIIKKILMLFKHL